MSGAPPTKKKLSKRKDRPQEDLQGQTLLKVGQVTKQQRHEQIATEAAEGKKKTDEVARKRKIEQLAEKKREKQARQEAVRKQFMSESAGVLKEGEEESDEEEESLQIFDDDRSKEEKDHEEKEKRVTAKELTQKDIDEEDEEEETQLKKIDEEEIQLQKKFIKGDSESDSEEYGSTSPDDSEDEDGDPVDKEERMRRDAEYGTSKKGEETSTSDSSAVPKDIELDPYIPDAETLAKYKEASYAATTKRTTVNLAPELSRPDEISFANPEDSARVLQREKEEAKLLEEAEKIKKARENRKRREFNRSDSEISQQSLSQLATAATGVKTAATIRSGSSQLRVVELSADFTFEKFGIAITNGPCKRQHCNNSCDDCINYFIASAYAADPIRMAKLLTGGKPVAPNPELVVTGTPKPSTEVYEKEDENIRIGKKSKRILEMLKAKNAVSIDPNAEYLNTRKYPWKILGVIDEHERPLMRKMTQSVKVRFGPEVRKKINQHIDAHILSLINSGKLEAAHFTIIPTQDYQNLTEEARLRAFGQVPVYWQMFYEILDGDDSVVWAWVNMEVHPATNNKGKMDQEKAQKDVEQEMEEDAVRDGVDGDHEEELHHIPDDYNEQQKKRLEAANAVIIAKRDKKKKAELAEKITEVIKAIDVILVPLIERKDNGAILTQDEENEVKRLMKDRKKYEKARPNVLAGFPHFDIFVVRDKKLLPYEGRPRVSTFVHMHKELRARGCSDVVLKRIFKRKGKADKSIKNDLTFEARYPLIGHNCNTALHNMKAAGFLLDDRRGLTWQYYRKSKHLSENWHNSFRNFVVGLQKLDGISLSDEADQWTMTETTALDEDEAGVEELMVDRIKAYMEIESYFLYGDNTIIRPIPGSEMSAEVVFRSIEDFSRHLNTVPTLRRDLLSRLNYITTKNVAKLDLPRADFCFDAIELKDGFFIVTPKLPDKWEKILQRSGGFFMKHRVYNTLMSDGKPGSCTAKRILTDKGFGNANKFLSFCDLNMTVEQMKKPPVVWLKAMGRYFCSKVPEEYSEETDKMVAARKELQRCEAQVAALDSTKPKKAGPDKVGGGLTALELHSAKIEAARNLKVAEKALFEVEKWTSDQERHFFEMALKLLFIPAHRQENMFIVGRTGSGKTISICWIFGETLKTDIADGIPYAKGLFDEVNVATMGGTFSMGAINAGITRICVIQEMTASRAKIADLLTFLEHGQIEVEKKYGDRKHGHSGFSMAFTGNKKLFIKNDPEVTKALRDRCGHVYMRKKVPKNERDPTIESKVRLEKFNIVHYLVTRRWDTEIAKWWKERETLPPPAQTDQTARKQQPAPIQRDPIDEQLLIVRRRIGDLLARNPRTPAEEIALDEARKTRRELEADKIAFSK